MQRRPPADGANHLHARAFAVSAFDVDDFITLAHAQVDGLLNEFVQITHRSQGRIAHIESALDHVAQFQQTHAQSVVARLRAVYKAAGGQIVQDAVRRRGVQPGFLADLLERDGFFAGRQHIDQGEHAFNHLDGGRGRVGGVFFHRVLPSHFILHSEMASDCPVTLTQWLASSSGQNGASVKRLPAPLDPKFTGLEA